MSDLPWLGLRGCNYTNTASRQPFQSPPPQPPTCHQPISTKNFNVASRSPRPPAVLLSTTTFYPARRQPGPTSPCHTAAHTALMTSVMSMQRHWPSLETVPSCTCKQKPRPTRNLATPNARPPLLAFPAVRYRYMYRTATTTLFNTLHLISTPSPALGDAWSPTYPLLPSLPHPMPDAGEGAYTPPPPTTLPVLPPTYPDAKTNLTHYPLLTHHPLLTH